MYKSVIVFIFACVLAACANDQNNPKPPLRIESVDFDSKDMGEIQQIVFVFNQNIAVLGGVPTSAQIDAVTITPYLKELCVWRFVDQHKLACEMQQPPQSMTQYTIAIDGSFTALGNTLIEPKTVTIETGMPNFNIGYNYDNQESLRHLTIYNFNELNFTVEALENYLQLRLPDGSYQDLNFQVIKDYPSQHHLVLTPLDFDLSAADGEYALVLRKGFRASESQIRLAQDFVIDKFWFNHHFKFLGFSCFKNAFPPEAITEFKFDSTSQLDCNPERLAISFSRQLDLETNYLGIHSVPWLNGPQYKVTSSYFNKGQHYYALALTGDSTYEIDLSKIKSSSGDVLDTVSKVAFSTEPALPFWYLADDYGTIAEADSMALPYLFRRNVDELSLTFQAINSAEGLLRFLSGERKHSAKILSPNSAENRHQIAPQAIDFRQHLAANNGLAFLTVSGKTTEYSSSNEIETKSSSLMLQAADFNLAVWNSKDLLVQAIDWHAEPITQATVSLICENTQQPIQLGATDEHGILWVQSDDWTPHALRNSNQECWIWTQAEDAISAIQLPAYYYTMDDDINAFAWTTQPIYTAYDTIQIGFIARTRGNSGLQPVTDLSNYTLELQLTNSNKVQSLNLSQPSSFGFANAAFKSSAKHELGNYIIYLKNIRTGNKQRIGEFAVNEFNPPEFEVHLKSITEANAGEKLPITIQANWMNGEPLRGATTKVSIDIRKPYDEPENWPNEFNFQSWEDFNRNDNDMNISGLNGSLDSFGSKSFELAKLESTVPYGKLIIDAEVISDSGEAQFQQLEVPYFSRNHYIGTRFDNDNQLIEFVAVDKDGNALSDIKLKAKIFLTDDNDELEDTALMECTLMQLPGSCNIDEIKEHATVVIESGDEQYQWRRNFYSSRSRQSDTTEQQATFKLSELSQQPTVGDTISLSLNTSIGGTASFIIQAGDVKKVWHQEVTEGNNAIQLTVEPSWVPYARVYASLPVDRQKAQALAHKSIKDSASAVNKLPPELMSQRLRSKRLLTSKMTIQALPNETPPKVELTVEDDAVQAGSEVELTISSNIDADSQIWLVNDAIFDLMNANESDFDYYQQVMSSTAFEGSLSFDASSQHLMLDLVYKDARSDLNIGGSSAAVMSRTAPPPPPMALGFDMDMMLDQFAQKPDDEADFAQSIWLDTKRLVANQPSTFRIKLPQLIGRWKVLALTTTNQTMSIDSASFSTEREIEYFLEAPSSILSDDDASYSVAQSNRTNHAVTDELTLLVNGQTQSKIDVVLERNEYKRVTLQLPKLPPGDHIVKITSKNQSGFAAMRKIHVADGQQSVTRTWLQQANSDTVLLLPATATDGSVTLQFRAAGQRAPDWASLLSTTKNYPHQCWEQTISRAVAYQSNPLANSHWQTGTTELNRLLASSNQYKAYDGLYSYFPNQVSDSLLSAYTYFVSALLDDTSTPLNIDSETLKSNAQRILDGSYLSEFGNRPFEAKSMAFLALVYNNQLTLNEGLKVRQKLGSSNTSSALLQALALKKLGADKPYYESTLNQLQQATYTDSHLSIFNQNSDKCLAAMVYDEDSLERESLLNEVINSQQQHESFGSTYANAICAYALKEHEYDFSEFKTVDFKVSGSRADYQLSRPQAHWLKLTYMERLHDIKAHSQGISVARKLYVKRNEQWLEVTPTTSLHLGEIIKTTITIDSPKNREHVAISDSVAGGFEAINPLFGQLSMYRDAVTSWIFNNSIEIREGKTYWYIRNLTKGEHELTYFSRVRHTGTFGIAPTQVETMYRNDVRANTTAFRVQVAKN